MIVVGMPMNAYPNKQCHNCTFGEIVKSLEENEDAYYCNAAHMYMRKGIFYSECDECPLIQLVPVFKKSSTRSSEEAKPVEWIDDRNATGYECVKDESKDK